MHVSVQITPMLIDVMVVVQQVKKQDGQEWWNLRL